MRRARPGAAARVAIGALLLAAASAAGVPGPCPPAPPPAGVPDGWVRYGDWACGCRLFVPGDGAMRVPPVRWHACPAAAGTPPCEAMVSDWTRSAVPIALTPRADRTPDGRAVIAFTRDATDSPVPHTLHLVAEADGRVLSATLALWEGESLHDPRCHLVDEAIGEGRHLRVPRGDGTPAGAGAQGALGGTLDDSHPRVLARISRPTGFKYSWAVGARWIAKLGERLTALPWDLSREIVIASAASDPEGLAPSQLVVSGDAVFWTTADLERSGINVWDPVRGARPFQRWIGDTSRGAGNLGTDGVDLVWSYGEGGRRWVMTAPLTTDPAALGPRRLRAEPHRALANSAYHVGCGHASHRAGPAEVVVVRIADGFAWRIGSEDPVLRVRRPIGLTCRHVYVLAQVADRWTVARFPLDALGPGVPPE